MTSRTLGCPDWARPFSQLPGIAPETATANPHLARYPTVAALRTCQALAVGVPGWHTGPAIADEAPEVTCSLMPGTTDAR